MVISNQQIADAVFYAKKFYKNAEVRTACSMCPILADMAEDAIEDFFRNLYIWNNLSHDVAYNRERHDFDAPLIEIDFRNAVPRGRDTNLLQFVHTLEFLLYNIEDHTIKDVAYEDEFWGSIVDREQLTKDIYLLTKIIQQICRRYMDAQMSLSGTKWAYN